MFIEDKITMGVIVETTPGTPGTILAANYNVRVGGIQYDHVAAEYKRKYAKGHHSNSKSIIGKQTGTFSFYVDMADGSSINVANPVSKLLNACGVLDTVMTTTGVKYNPYSPYDVKPVTLEFVEKDEGTSPVQLIIRYAGCMGNCRMVLNEVGQPVRYEFEMQGKLVSITDRAFGSILVPVFVSTEPTRVLAATITRGAVVQGIESFTLDFGNEVMPKTDPADATGVSHFYITKREPKLTINPYVRTLSADPAYTEWIAGTTGLFTFTIGNHSITVPKAQYVGLKPGIRNGARIYEKTFLCVENSDAGDDEWKHVQGAES